MIFQSRRVRCRSRSKIIATVPEEELQRRVSRFEVAFTVAAFKSSEHPRVDKSKIGKLASGAFLVLMKHFQLVCE